MPKAPYKKTFELPPKLSWHILETSMKLTWNFLETLLKLSENALEISFKHSWNVIKKTFDFLWTSLETCRTEEWTEWHCYILSLSLQLKTLGSQISGAWKNFSNGNCLSKNVLVLMILLIPKYVFGPKKKFVSNVCWSKKYMVPKSIELKKTFESKKLQTTWINIPWTNVKENLPNDREKTTCQPLKFS